MRNLTRTNYVRIDITMNIEFDFDVITKQLRGMNFHLQKDGYLAYKSPFLNPGEETMTFKFRPLTNGSKNFTVVFEGAVTGVLNCLELAFSFYNATPKMVRYDLFDENYSVNDFNEIICSDTSWNSTSPRVYKANGRFGASCLLMDDKVEFMTRKVKSLKDVSDFIQECYHLSDVFKTEEKVDLFTYNAYQEIAI